jgi:hypothetical protein
VTIDRTATTGDFVELDATVDVKSVRSFDARATDAGAALNRSDGGDEISAGDGRPASRPGVTSAGNILRIDLSLHPDGRCILQIDYALPYRTRFVSASRMTTR